MSQISNNIFELNNFAICFTLFEKFLCSVFLCCKSILFLFRFSFWQGVLQIIQ